MFVSDLESYPGQKTVVHSSVKSKIVVPLATQATALYNYQKMLKTKLYDQLVIYN